VKMRMSQENGKWFLPKITLIVGDIIYRSLE